MRATSRVDALGACVQVFANLMQPLRDRSLKTRLSFKMEERWIGKIIKWEGKGWDQCAALARDLEKLLRTGRRDDK